MLEESGEYQRVSRDSLVGVQVNSILLTSDMSEANMRSAAKHVSSDLGVGLGSL